MHDTLSSCLRRVTSTSTGVALRVRPTARVLPAHLADSPSSRTTKAPRRGRIAPRG